MCLRERQARCWTFFRVVSVLVHNNMAIAYNHLIARRLLLMLLLSSWVLLLLYVFCVVLRCSCGVKVPLCAYKYVWMYVRYEWIGLARLRSCVRDVFGWQSGTKTDDLFTRVTKTPKLKETDAKRQFCLFATYTAIRLRKQQNYSLRDKWGWSRINNILAAFQSIEFADQNGWRRTGKLWSNRVDIGVKTSK